MDKMELISILTYWHRLWFCSKFLCSIFHEGKFWKLTYKKLKTLVKSMKVWSCFSERWDYNYFKLVGLIVSNIERINTIQWKEQNQHSSVFKVLR